MSNYSSKSVDGDLQVRNDVNIGRNVNVRAQMKVDRDLVVGGALVSKFVNSANMGLYADADTLNAQQPSPKVGQYAGVGETMPAVLYVCQTAGTWTETAGEYKNEVTASEWQNIYDTYFKAEVDNKIDTGNVQTSDITDEAVTTNKLADKSVTAEKLADGILDTTNIKDGAVTLQKMDTDLANMVKAAVGAPEEIIKQMEDVTEDISGFRSEQENIKSHVNEANTAASEANDKANNAQEQAISASTSASKAQASSTSSAAYAAEAKDYLSKLQVSMATLGDGAAVSAQVAVNTVKLAASPSLSGDSEADVDMCDENGNVIARLKNGHIQTKNFDSSKSATEDAMGLMSPDDKIKLDYIKKGAEINSIKVLTDTTSDDINVTDESGNVILQISGGHIKTKMFDSSNISNASKWSGKKVLFLGDSITDQNRWVSAFQVITDCIVYNRGVSGTRYSQIAGRTNALCERVDYTRSDATTSHDVGMPLSAELVFCFAGINDWGQGRRDTPHLAIGDANAEVDKTTFAGAIRYTLNKLREYYPTAKIVVITPMKSYGYSTEFNFCEKADTASSSTAITLNKSADGKTFYDYQQTIKDVANLLSIPVIDMNQCGFSALDANDNAAYFVDGLHPNQDGANLMANYIVNQLNNI